MKGWAMTDGRGIKKMITAIIIPIKVFMVSLFYVSHILQTDSLVLRCFYFSLFEKLDTSSFAEFFVKRWFEFGFPFLWIKKRVWIQESLCDSALCHKLHQDKTLFFWQIISNCPHSQLLLYIRTAGELNFSSSGLSSI